MNSGWTRRRFLGTTAGIAGAAALAAGRGAQAADDKSKEATDKYGGFLMGIQSYTLRNFKVDEALTHVQNLGLHSIEFFDAHFTFNSTPDQIEAMKKKTASMGMKIMAHGVNPFGKDHEANRRYFEFAQKAGIRNLSADPSEDSFESLDKLVKEYDIRIAIHNHGPGARYDKVNDVLTAIKGHDERIGACADLGHYIRSAEDPVRVINLLQGRLFGIHLKDYAEQKKDAQGVILGKGHLDVEGVFRALKKVNFPADGALSLEYEEKPENPLDDVKACLAIASAAAIKAASA